MTVSPTSAFLLAFTAAAGRRAWWSGATLVALAVTVATAAPGARADDQAAPQGPTTLIPGTPVPAETAPAPADTAPPSIEVNPLGDISLDSVGVLGPENGGFGQDLWRDTDRDFVDSLLRRLPSDIRSPTLRELARRLLLTIATPPVAPMGAAQPRGNSLLALRAERLAAMGEVDGVNELLAVVSSRQDDEPMARTRLNGLLLAHNNDEACRLVRNGIAAFHEQAYWQKALIFCNMVAGDTDKVMLGIDLLREMGAPDDPLFVSLATGAANSKLDLPPDADLTPLHLAMMTAAGRSIPMEMVEQASPDLLVAIARSPTADPAVRARAAERGCAAGLISGEALAKIYGSFSFTAGQVANAISSYTASPGPQTRAMLYQAARGQSLPTTRAEVLRVALQPDGNDGIYEAMVRAFLPLLLEVPPSPDLSWFAGTAGRALYATGKFEAANGWLALGRQEAFLNPQAATAVAALWPYSRLAGDVALTTDGSLAAWSSMRGGTSDAEQSRRQTLLRAAFQALGEQDSLPWDTIAMASAAEPRPLPAAALFYALLDASESQRVGETVLLTLVVLGTAGPADSHVMALSWAIAALNRIGLEHEARALAIEAALANGV